MATTSSIKTYVQSVKSYLTDKINKIIFDVEQCKIGTKFLTHDEIVQLRGTILRHNRDYEYHTSIMIYHDIREIWKNFTETQTYKQVIPQILKIRNKSQPKIKKEPKIKKVPKTTKVRQKREKQPSITEQYRMLKKHNEEIEKSK